jgi:hypothetical protein
MLTLYPSPWAPHINHASLPADQIVSTMQAVDFVRGWLQRGMAPRKICEDLCDACLAPNTNGCGRGESLLLPL